MKKTITLGELFTEKELKAAHALFEKSPPGTFNTVVVREVITPEVMARIDEKTGQSNNASYWGYALEHAFGSK